MSILDVVMDIQSREPKKAKKVLTDRQAQIFDLVREGYSTFKISELCGITVVTVDHHLANISNRFIRQRQVEEM